MGWPPCWHGLSKKNANLGSILSVVSHHLAHRCVKIGGGFREGLRSRFQIWVWTCGWAIKQSQGGFRVRPSGKSASGIIFGKSLGKWINLRLKFQNGKFTNMWLAIMLENKGCLTKSRSTKMCWKTLRVKYHCWYSIIPTRFMYGVWPRWDVLLIGDWLWVQHHSTLSLLMHMQHHGLNL